MQKVWVQGSDGVTVAESSGIRVPGSAAPRVQLPDVWCRLCRGGLYRRSWDQEWPRRAGKERAPADVMHHPLPSPNPPLPLLPRAEVRHDPSDHAAELVAVAGEPGRDEHVVHGRVAVQDEVLVGDVGEHARHHAAGGAGRLREVGCDSLAEGSFVFRGAFPVQAIGVGQLSLNRRFRISGTPREDSSLSRHTRAALSC